jgi:hypothetical protein
VWTIALLVTALLTVPEAVVESALLPDGINQILGRIRPDMSETELAGIVTLFYPEAEPACGIWSGQSGYVDFRLTPRWSVSIAEYNAPNDFESRFVHPEMTFYVYDWEVERRIDITFYGWGEAVPEEGSE